MKSVREHFPVMAAAISVLLLLSIISNAADLGEDRLENIRLKKQIVKLEAELADSRLTELEYEQLQGLRRSLGHIGDDEGSKRVTAKVTASDSSDIFDTFIINAGTDQGISADDMVAGPEGLAGRVSDAGRGWSKIKGTSHTDVSVSFMVQRDPSVIGVVTGDGAGSLTGYLFDDEDMILLGDTIVTSGLGSYPAGLKIATVTSVMTNKNTLKKEITAVPASDFDSIRTVTVITKNR